MVAMINDKSTENAVMSVFKIDPDDYEPGKNRRDDSWWRRRTRLEHFLIISFFVVFIVITLSIVVITGMVLHHEIKASRLLVGESVSLCLTPGCVQSAAIIIESMNPNVSPCDDFFEYACGGWIKSKHISDDKIGVTEFGTLRDQLQHELREVLEKVPEKSEAEFFATMRNFYKECTDLTKIDEVKSRPLEDILTSLGGWPMVEGINWNSSSFSWIDTMFKLRKLGFSHSVLVSIYVGADIKMSERNAIHMDQPSLGVPNRKYLLRGLNDTVVKAYMRAIVSSATLLGLKEKSVAEAQARDIIMFETKLAEFSIPSEKRRNFSQLYHKMTIDDVNQLAPSIDWLTIVQNIISPTVEANETVIVKTPLYLKKLEQLVNETDKRTIANYMLWRVVFASMSHLSKEWRDINEVYDQTISGRSGEKPRWEVCMKRVDTYFSTALSSLYVRKNFDEESRQNVESMVKNIRTIFLDLLRQTDWMDLKTKQKAIEKATAMRAQLGYAREILDDEKLAEIYRGLTLGGQTYFSNLQLLRKFWIDTDIGKLNQTNKKDDWKKFAKPAAINAFYNSIENAIKFPAGVLQGKFFKKDRPHYLNYGAIGYIIGHEITHGFDDRGRQFDKNGNNENWWEPETDQKFKSRANCIISQYNNYTLPEINENINGINTQGENIADNGGMKEAYLAYQNYVKANGKEPLLPGLTLTQNQLFFISSANIWCSKFRPETLKLRLQTSVHSPARYRVIGPMSNMHQFSEVFDCPLGSPMNPHRKCTVW